MLAVFIFMIMATISGIAIAKRDRGLMLSSLIIICLFLVSLLGFPVADHYKGQTLKKFSGEKIVLEYRKEGDSIQLWMKDPGKQPKSYEVPYSDQLMKALQEAEQLAKQQRLDHKGFIIAKGKFVQAIPLEEAPNGK